MTSAHIRLARLLLAGQPVTDPELMALAAAHADTIAPMRAMLAGVDHTRADVAAIAVMFDMAATVAAEAAVAAYSLGDPATLAAATAELVGFLRAGGWLGGDALDLGCGIGRVAAAIAPHCRGVRAVDVSAAMIARAPAVPGVSYAVTGGQGIAGADGSLDLILAVDSWPYLVQAGVDVAHWADAVRLLRPGGGLVVCNLCYDGTAAVRAVGYRGLVPVHEGVSPFTLWDGVVFSWRAPTHPPPPR